MITATCREPAEIKAAAKLEPHSRAGPNTSHRDFGTVPILRGPQRPPATESTDQGNLPWSQSPSGRSASQCSTPGVVDSTSHSDSTTRPGASGPSASIAWPTSRARRAPAARCVLTSFTKRSSSASNISAGLTVDGHRSQTCPDLVRSAATSS